MVMVHENREILTHNSRRFLVVCNFVPETFTLTASVAVPTHLLKRKYKTDDNQSHSIDSNVISSKPNEVMIYLHTITTNNITLGTQEC